MPAPTDGTWLDHPFRVDARGRAATAGLDDHIRDMIEAVLFTAPGERVMRPDFGCGLSRLAFEPLGSALATGTQQMVHGALLRWLEDWILVDTVEVATEESTLLVKVVYTRRDTGAREVAAFRRPGDAA